jgi:acyl-CoA synthetase (AMP-forming)/AMP-acid ligase II
VVGVDHPTLGQEVSAFVVAKRGMALSEDEVKGWCRATLAGFKVPAQVEFRAELPHNAAGKVVKHLLARAEVRSDFIQE